MLKKVLMSSVLVAAIFSTGCVSKHPIRTPLTQMQQKAVQVRKQVNKQFGKSCTLHIEKCDGEAPEQCTGYLKCVEQRVEINGYLYVIQVSIKQLNKWIAQAEKSKNLEK